MSASSLVFNKGKAIEKLAFVSESVRTGPRITMFVQTVLLVLIAVLTAKILLVDYPASARFLEPTTIMSFEVVGGLSFVASVYWFLSGLHLRVTGGRHWQTEAVFGLLVVVLACVLFAFGISHNFTSVFSNYVYGDLVWFGFGFLLVSLVPWAAGTYHVIRQKRPLRLFVLSGLLIRLLLLASLVVLAVYFSGAKIYDYQLTNRLLLQTGFDTPLHGFISILWCLLFLLCFGCVAALVTIVTFGADALSKSTFKPNRSILFGTFCAALVTFGYLLDHYSFQQSGPLVWTCLAITLALATVFLTTNWFLKIAAMPELMRTLTVCLQLLTVIIVSFGLQYFMQATASDRVLAFLLAVPSLLFLCAHLYATGVGRGEGAKWTMVLLISSAGSSALTYLFLVKYGFDSLLPGEIPARTLFNFILIGSVLFVAVFACCRLLLATNGATRLLALRAGAVQGGNS